MPKLAIDIVLLPSDEVIEKAIEINKDLLKQIDSDLRLDKENCLPHITLTMGIAKEDAFKKIFAETEVIAAKFNPLLLTIPKVEVYESANRVISGFRVSKTPGLQKIHEEVIKRIKDSHFTYDAKPEYFLQPPVMKSLGSYWESKGPELKILGKYDPHITLGYGRANLDQPIKFEAPTLAVCHLGKHSTCRKILYSTTLTKKP